MEENICRLCLNVVKNEFEIMDAATRQMLEVLSLNIDLDASENSIVCSSCVETMKKSYFFKTACMDTEAIIRSFSTTKGGAKFNMTDVYKDSKNLQVVIDEDLNICRFCINQIGSNSVSIEKLMKDMTYMAMFKVYMPDMVFNIIKDSIICTTCWENLECYFNLSRNYLDTEDKINKYRQSGATGSTSQIKLSNVLSFSFKSSSYPNNCTQTSLMKQESSFQNVEHNEELIKCETLDIKDEHVLLANSCDKNITKVEMYKCEKCTHETKCKRYLKSHMLKHKDISEVKMHKCGICHYETRYKYAIKKHVLMMHKKTSEVEMYKCEICIWETRYKSNLKKHMIIHKDVSEVEMYKCEICTYETRYQVNLRRHVVLHKNTTEGEIHKSMCESKEIVTRKMQLYTKGKRRILM